MFRWVWFWFGFFVGFLGVGVFFQILTKIVTLVKLSKPHQLTQEICDKLANGEPHVVSTTRRRA